MHQPLHAHRLQSSFQRPLQGGGLRNGMRLGCHLRKGVLFKLAASLFFQHPHPLPTFSLGSFPWAARPCCCPDMCTVTSQLGWLCWRVVVIRCLFRTVICAPEAAKSFLSRLLVPDDQCGIICWLSKQGQCGGGAILTESGGR